MTLSRPIALLLACLLLPTVYGLAQYAVAAGPQTEDSASEPPPEEDTEVVDPKSVRGLIESEERAEALIRERASALTNLEGTPRTPLQLLLMLSAANEAGDQARAASFLDMRYLPEEMADQSPEDLLSALSIVWQQQNLVDITSISDEPEGYLDDGLPEYRDLLGRITKVDGEKVPVYLQRIPDGRGGQKWAVSNTTVARIPELWADLGYGPFTVWLQNNLPRYEIAGLKSWQLLAGALFLVGSWYASVLISWGLKRLALLIPNIFPKGIERFFNGPLRLFLFLLLFRELMGQLALALTARIYLNSSGLDYIAFSILLMGIIDLLRDYNIRRMERLGNLQGIALLRPLTTIVKLFLLLIIGLVWAERAGYSMSTVLAGLGVGSLAIALAAQKTLENVIGAFTLYAARPVQSGDLCRFGDKVGVVEEIGLRSTTLRTLDRTILAIPNSMFSSVEIENFSQRDRIRFYRHVEIQITDADQLRVVLERLRTRFHEQTELIEETVSIRLERIEYADAEIRIDCGIRTTDFQEYLRVAEVLNLAIIDTVTEAGAQLTPRPAQLQVE